jgi:hypothetical protein|tara:strand:+ start:24 stop:293 length:270 start_codon:yes stop_codon:yes gene_type:complete
MLSQFRIWLWGMVAELEYKLYPWKTSTPPAWAAERYGADTNTIHDNHEFNYESLHYDWLKSHDDKINRLQDEMIWVQKEIIKLQEHDRV